MKFAKLVVMGFKSFADRTEFEFDSGLTGLVGPNGCGKSNVVDAIKWVLGEQRPTSLRGKEMGDVIFNGNATRKSMGFCEVTLHINNADRTLKLDTDEVVITRRLYRDGKSEYLINKNASRLRELKELFMDTGVGMDNYSVFEQGKIERLLQSNPVERRMVFEEAAGISKYRSKRKETERKLESTQQNLLRLNDVIDELGKRIASVKRQASKAEKYQQFYTELKQMQTTLALRDYKQFSDELEGVLSHVKEFSDGAARVATRIDTLEARLSQHETRLLELESEITSHGQAVHERDSVIRSSEERISSAGAQVQAIDNDRREGEGRIEVTQARLAEIEKDMDRTRRELEGVAADLARREAAADEARAGVEAMDREFHDLQAAVDAHRNEVFRAERERADTANQIEAERQGRAMRGARHERLKAHLADIAQRLTPLETERIRVQAAVGAIESGMAGLNDKLRTFERERGERKQEISQLSAAVDALKQTVASAQSRLDVLRDYKAKMVGAGAGIKAVLAEENRRHYAAVRGLLADHFDVDRRYARAIEAALGERAGTLLVDGTHHLQAYAAHFKAAGKGRAMFFALGAEAAPAASAPLPEGAMAWAAAEVRVQPELRPLFDRLLAGTVIVDSLDAAFRAAAAHPGMSCVTVDGDVLHADGSLVVGPAEGVGMVMQRVELQDVENSLAGQQRELQTQSVAFAACRQRLEEIEAGIKETRQSIYENNVALLEKKNELSLLDKELGSLGAESRADAGEFADIERELAESQAKEAVLTARLRDLERAVAAEQSALDAAKIRVPELDVELAGRRDALTQLKVDLARVAAERDARRAAESHLQAERRDKEHVLGETRRRLRENEQRRQALREDVRDLEVQIHESMTAKAGLETALAALQRTRDELREDIGIDREVVRELQRESRTLDEQLNELRIRENQLGMQIEHLKLRMRDEYQIDLEVAIREFKPEDVEGIDWDQLRALIEEYKQKIRNLGNVNLDSLQELRELEERWSFLTQQKSDLDQAVISLQGVIQHIDDTCKDLFTRTFEMVAENFRLLFRKLFGGGKADLILTDPANVLDSGIDIIARPPGKLPKNLTLLSGGEKAMTTMALLFSIFKSRPAPFCILDEVDAPLDENNVERFVTMLREFLDVSQFLVITHNKRTMSMSDRLYGVTQQENGVSKKISIHFEKEQAVA